ncbi:MAG: SpoIIIAH-like family protein [Oscillospiraceae bacterium]|nr:SpoIIIAH-like family protein [Oscillospiraceae bacterium]
MKLWKRNMVVAAIVLFVCAAVYLNWSYTKDAADTGKVLGQATQVGAQSSDPLLNAPTNTPATPTDSTSGAGISPAGSAQPSVSEQEQLQSGYFDSARLNRQQARDGALSILQQTVGNADADQTMKDQAGAAIQTLANYTVSEAQIENLVTAKGYADCVAFIGDDSVSVVVAATETGLTDADIAKITEIVTGETGLEAGQIKIIEADP